MCFVVDFQPYANPLMQLHRLLVVLNALQS